MANGWEWRGRNGLFHAQRNNFALVVSLEDSDEWTGTACIASPDEDDTGGVTIPCNKTFATKEEAQDAVIITLREFVEKLHADL